MLEGLEDRRLLSTLHSGTRLSTAAFIGRRVFAAQWRQFTYTTPTGGAGRDPGGRPRQSGRHHGEQLRRSSIWSTTGPTRTRRSSATSRAVTAARPWPASSIASSSRPEAQNSLSGVGGNVIKAVYLSNFDLIAGGNINLTSGVNTLVLDSVGPDTQIHLRALPPAPATTTVLPTSSLLVVQLAVADDSRHRPAPAAAPAASSIFRAFATTTTTSTSGTGTTLEADSRRPSPTHTVYPART